MGSPAITFQLLQRINTLALLKPIVFTFCLLPLLFLVLNGLNNHLGANPAETIIRSLGDWSLYLLVITLSITPVKNVFGLKYLVRVRRMLGLFVFFYVCLHIISYIWFDQFFDWNEIVKDIIKRPFITLGFICFVLLIPLAVTSTNKMMLRLKKRWKLLHRLVYPISVMATLHYFWMTRADFRQPTLVAVILALLLLYRVFQYWQKRAGTVQV